MTVDSTGTSSKLGASISDYFALLKPRVMSLVVFTGFAGLLVAPGNLEPLLALISILCIAISAGAAGAINMWYERDIDSLMERTCNRPIPAGRIAPNRALLFGVILNILPVLAMGILLNWVAASLLALLRVFIYSCTQFGLKERHLKIL